MSKRTCPADEELVPLLAGEPVGNSLGSHLRECEVCSRRLDLLRSDLATLRSLPSDATSQTASMPPRA